VRTIRRAAGAGSDPAGGAQPSSGAGSMKSLAAEAGSPSRYCRSGLLCAGLAGPTYQGVRGGEGQQALARN
jgi:hypothetical protein